MDDGDGPVGPGELWRAIWSKLVEGVDKVNPGDLWFLVLFGGGVFLLLSVALIAAIFK